MAGPAHAGEAAKGWQVDNTAAYTASALAVRLNALNIDNRLDLPQWHGELAVRLAAESRHGELRVRLADSRTDPAGTGQRGAHRATIEAVAGHLRPTERLTLTAGKTSLAWDDAQSLQPLGFLGPLRGPAAAFSALPAREGVPLLAARYRPPGWPDGRVSLVLSDQPGYRRTELQQGLGPAGSAPTGTRRVAVYQRPRAQAALRVAHAGELVELAGVLRTATGAPLGAGGRLAVAPMAGTRLYASAFASRGHNRLQNVMAEGGQGDFATRAPFARSAQNDGRLYPRAVAGLRLGADALNWWLEASYDARGLSPRQWQRWEALVATHRRPPPGISRDRATQNLQWDARTLAYGPARRRYVATGFNLDSRRWRGRLTARWGVADDSLGAGGRLVLRLGPQLGVAALGRFRTALTDGGEFARHPYAGHGGLGVRLAF